MVTVDSTSLAANERLIVSTVARESSQVTAPNHVPFADGWRAVAIFAVLLMHASMFQQPRLFFHGVNLAKLMLNLGLVGIEMLFMLTGFLLCAPYLAAIGDPSRPWPSARDFYWRRFLRIWPLYAFAVIMLAFVPSTNSNLHDVVAHMLMIHTFSAATAESITGVMWTMGVDTQFYLALPLLALAAAAILRRHPISVRTLIIRAVILSTIIAVLYRGVVTWLHPGIHAHSNIQIVLLRHLGGMLPAFLFGMFAFNEGRRVTFDETLLRPKTGTTLVALGICIIFADAVWLGATPRASHFWETLTFATYDLFAAVGPALIFYGIVIGGAKTVRDALSTRAMTIAAGLSYAVYLFHYTIISELTRHVPKALSPNVAFVLVLVLAVLLSSAVAYFAHRYIEVPGMRMRDRFKGNGVGSGAPATPVELA